MERLAITKNADSGKYSAGAATAGLDGWSGNGAQATFRQYVQKFVTSFGMDILGELEDKYDCASVCEVPLFYITRDISEGRPLQECAAGIYHSMKGSYRAEAAFSIILSLVLWTAMTCALMIGCGPDLSEPEDDGNQTEAKEDGPRKDPASQYAASDPPKESEMQNQPGAINDDNKEEPVPSLPEGDKKEDE
jgi:hypothetical protein